MCTALRRRNAQAVRVFHQRRCTHSRWRTHIACTPGTRHACFPTKFSTYDMYYEGTRARQRNIDSLQACPQSDSGDIQNANFGYST